MIQEAIEKIQSLADAARQTTVLKTDTERNGIYYLVGPDGKAERKLAEPSWHTEKLATPQQLVAFIANQENKTGAVFYDQTSIAFVFDAEDRRNRATVALPLSPQHKTLTENASKMLTQVDFIRLLRIGLRGSLGDGNLLGIVRNLKFNNDTSGTGTVERGRESMSKSVINQVMGAEAFPEDVTLTIPVFENFDMRVNVACALEIFPTDRTFRITPYPLELQRAMRDTLAAIANLFSKKDSPPVYNGSV